MRFPLTDEFLAEAETYNFKSSCQSCFFYVKKTGACAHEWPNDEQRRWPLVVEGEEPPGEVPICKEFELA